MRNSVKLSAIAIFFFFAFNLNAQVPITYYSFQTGTNYSTFTQSVNQTINTVSSSTFSRNSGSTVSNTNGSGLAYSGIRTGKAIYSTDWIISSTDPGSSASKYYTFKVNTNSFTGISLRFDFATNSTSGVSRAGILYSINGGTSFTALGTYDISQSPGYWNILNIDYSSITGLNNKSEVIFRIYGYGAANSSSFLILDNVLVSSLSTTGSGSVTLLNEPNIFSSYTGGQTGYFYLRNSFTVTNGTTVNLNSGIGINGTFTVNGTLNCGSVSNWIQGYTNDSTSTFNLNTGATIIIGDPDGITSSGMLGNINTLNRNFGTGANYTYKNTTGAYVRINNNEETGNETKDFTETNINSRNIPDSRNNIKEINNLDATSSNTGSGLPSTVNSLTIDNINNVNLTNSVTVTNTLGLTNGLLIIDSKSITLGSSATVSGTPSSTKMVVVDGDGEFRKVFPGTGTFTFPIGDAQSSNVYTPATLTFTSGTFSNGTIGMKIIKGKHPLNNSTNDYLTRSWVVTNNGITNFSYDVLMQYVAADVHGNESNIFYGKFDNATWILIGQANASNHTMSGTGLTGFSTFTGGEQGAMPVEMLAFTSNVIGRDAKLSWTTASEKNNNGFEIYRTKISDNKWDKIGFVKGSNNTSSAKTYTFSDTKLNAGKYNYKLKQIDNNGNYEYFTLNGTVEIGMPGKYNLSQNYPNPFNPVTKVDYDLPSDSKVNIKVYDMSGRMVMDLVNANQTAGNYSVSLNANNLSSGTYFYRLIATASNGNETVISKKMTVIK